MLTSISIHADAYRNQLQADAESTRRKVERSSRRHSSATHGFRRIAGSLLIRSGQWLYGASPAAADRPVVAAT